MPSETVPPATGQRRQVERGREHFSATEEKVLREYLDDFTTKSKEEQKDLLMFKIYRLIKAAGPQLTLEQWRIRKKKVKEWYYNHGRRPQVRRYGYVKPISLKYVIGHLKQEELYSKVVELAGGAPPGSRAFLGKYQQGLKLLMDNLSASERIDYEIIAKKWTNESPPIEVQRKLFSRSGYKMLREMDKVKYYQLGLVSCGLITHYDSKGDPNWMFLNHTPEFGPPGAPSFETMFRTEVQEICKAWAAYCAHIETLNTGVTADPEKFTRDRKKKRMQLEMEGSFPVLPDAPAEKSESAAVLQLMIREFMTLHYQLACGKESATPWSSMGKHQSQLWDGDMWPSDVMVKDPSKMVLGDCRQIVALWRKRQALGGASETFRFNFYIEAERLKPSVYSVDTPPVMSPMARLPASPVERAEVCLAEARLSQAEAPSVLHDSNTAASNQSSGLSSQPGRSVRPPMVPLEITPTAYSLPEPCDIDLPAAVTPPLPIQSQSIQENAVQDPHLSPVNEGNPHLPPHDVESDPPLGKGKKKRPVEPYSEDEPSSDPSTDTPATRHERRRALISRLSLVAPSPPVSDDDLETLPPRYNKKGKRKAADKQASRKKAASSRNRRKDNAAGDGSDIASGGNSRNTVGETGRGQTNAERTRIKPKPKPRRQPTAVANANGGLDETPEAQLDREDDLFIVRKSARTPKRKYNVAPPAQLRLEKEREANKRKGAQM